MEKEIYNIISIVLSPSIIPIYLTLIFSFFSPIGLGSLDPISSILIGSIFLSLLPIASIFYFSREDINIKRKKRTKVYLAYITSFLISSVIFWFYNSHIMFVISVNYAFVTSALCIINLFWKISAHTAGNAGPTTALIYVFGAELMPLYVLTLIVILARIKMGIHNLSQTIAGAIVAIIITSLVYTTLW